MLSFGGAIRDNQTVDAGDNIPGYPIAPGCYPSCPASFMAIACMVNVGFNEPCDGSTPARAGVRRNHRMFLEHRA